MVTHQCGPTFLDIFNFFISFTLFSHILDDSSRVKLSIIHGSPFDDYINANYMPVRTDSLKQLSASVIASVSINSLLNNITLLFNTFMIFKLFHLLP